MRTIIVTGGFGVLGRAVTAAFRARGEHQGWWLRRQGQRRRLRGLGTAEQQEERQQAAQHPGGQILAFRYQRRAGPQSRCTKPSRR